MPTLTKGSPCVVKLSYGKCFYGRFLGRKNSKTEGTLIVIDLEPRFATMTPFRIRRDLISTIKPITEQAFQKQRTIRQVL